MTKKPTLAFGKGLSAILADAAEVQLGKNKETAETPAEQTPASVSEIALTEIIPNPYQPRVTFDEDALKELAESIKALGIIQPLTLRQMPDGKYQIISGERRYRASKEAGLTSVPAYIRKADDGAMLEMAIVENIQRENLDAIETAIGFQRLIDECSLTQEAMASRVGKKRATITNYLRLLKLPPEIQKAVKAGLLSMGHAKVILGVEEPKMQLFLCEKVLVEGWSVRQLESYVHRLENPVKPAGKTTVQLSEKCRKISELIGGYFNGKVDIKQKSDGSGILKVNFKNEAQMEKFLSALESINR